MPSLTYSFIENGDYIVIISSFGYFDVTIQSGNVSCTGGSQIIPSNNTFSYIMTTGSGQRIAGSSTHIYFYKDIVTGNSITATGDCKGSGGETGSRTMNMIIGKLT